MGVLVQAPSEAAPQTAEEVQRGDIDQSLEGGDPSSTVDLWPAPNDFLRMWRLANPGPATSRGAGAGLGGRRSREGDNLVGVVRGTTLDDVRDARYRQRMQDSRLTAGRTRLVAARRLSLRGYQPWPMTPPRGYRGYWSTLKRELMMTPASEWPRWVRNEHAKLVEYCEQSGRLEILSGSISTLAVVHTWAQASRGERIINMTLPATPLKITVDDDVYRFYLHYGRDLETACCHLGGGAVFRVLGIGGSIALPDNQLDEIISWPKVTELPAMSLGMLGEFEPRRLGGKSMFDHSADGWITS